MKAPKIHLPKTKLRLLPSSTQCDLDLPREHWALSGAISGAIAGVAFLLGFLISYGALILPMAWISAGMLRQDPLLSPTRYALFAVLGTILHLGFSIGLGTFFSRLILCHVPGDPNQRSGDRTLVSGVFFGAAVWAVMTYLVLPWLNPAFRNWVQAEPARWCLMHLVFGALLFEIPSLRSWLTARYGRGR